MSKPNKIKTLCQNHILDKYVLDSCFDFNVLRRSPANHLNEGWTWQYDDNVHKTAFCLLLNLLRTKTKFWMF